MKTPEMGKIKSTGECCYCHKQVSKQAMTRHLNDHLKKLEPSSNAKDRAFHLCIEPDRHYGNSPYFIHLLISGDETFGDLDDFLREIWLECCGHMSAFRDRRLASEKGGWDIMEAFDLMEAGKTEEYEKIMYNATGEIPKSKTLSEILKPDYKLEYEYDYGSSTLLEVRVAGVFLLPAIGKKILSRNEPLACMCDMCRSEPAYYVCSVCAGYEEEGLFCKTCAKKHAKACADFKDYAKMKVVNSPRMGVCAYEGGIIDKQRDGVYREKE